MTDGLWTDARSICRRGRNIVFYRLPLRRQSLQTVQTELFIFQDVAYRTERTSWIAERTPHYRRCPCGNTTPSEQSPKTKSDIRPRQPAKHLNYLQISVFRRRAPALSRLMHLHISAHRSTYTLHSIFPEGRPVREHQNTLKNLESYYAPARPSKY